MPGAFQPNRPPLLTEMLYIFHGAPCIYSMCCVDKHLTKITVLYRDAILPVDFGHWFNAHHAKRHKATSQ